MVVPINILDFKLIIRETRIQLKKRGETEKS
jgi:hypothetical protein